MGYISRGTFFFLQKITKFKMATSQKPQKMVKSGKKTSTFSYISPTNFITGSSFAPNVYLVRLFNWYYQTCIDLIYKVKVTFQNIQNVNILTCQHFSPIKTENFKFFIYKSLSYFSLRNLVLLSKLPNFLKWPTYGHFVTDKCAKSHFHL